MPASKPETTPSLDRRSVWTAPPRPEWVARLNDEGNHLDIEGIVPLDEASLLKSACTRTGLDDFGQDDWKDHFRVLLKAIVEEADLNFIGRIYARSELLFYLQQRLEITAWYAKHPEIDDEEIKSPIWILGLGRCGTTIFHEVMSQDPQFRSPKHWEALLPCPPPTSDDPADPRIKRADPILTLPDRITPEFRSMHAINAELPCDDCEFAYASFFSEIWYFLFQIPSYAEYLRLKGPAENFEWHTRFLKLLQSGYKRNHWLLKNPSHIDRIPQLLKVYKDAKFIFLHRDPIVSSDSVTNIMGTIYWRCTDHPWSQDMLEDAIMVEGRAKMWEDVIDWIEDGTIQTGSHTHVQYKDLCERPLEVIQNVYRDLELDPTEGAFDKMEKYLEDKPKGIFGAHKYDVGDGRQDVIDAERKRYSRYQEYFGVVSEV